MGNSDITEDFSDWEEIQDPYDSHSPPPEVQQLDFELVIRDNHYDDGSSIFPPSEHEDLPLLSEDREPSDEDAFSQSSLPVAFSYTDPQKKQQKRTDSKLSTLLDGIRIRICTIHRRMFKLLASSFQCQSSSYRRYSSIVPATALAVVLFACMKILLWRNRLLLLVREKDQRISQLLNQLAHMNEILSARRKVPILRIN